ncbi:MAG: UbiA prenyltransferase family protein [Proteobacteria bacterium]|nr:UbiA prenyltransferase family protein [Pseudomonadota bacterium]
MTQTIKHIGAYVRLARPHQHLKNGFVFIPIIFGYKLTDVQALICGWWAFVAFSLAASSVYAFNDLRDAESDRQHPNKKNRPVASGEIGSTGAEIFSLVLLLVSVILSYFLLNKLFLLILMAYLFLNLAYSTWLKRLALVDVICIATGFVLRVLAGGAACGIWISNWLILMTFLLALFLAFAKRRDDLVLRVDRRAIRKSLGDYNLEFVDLSMVLTAGVIIVAYIMYSISADVVAKHGTDKLYVSSIWVILGILRYFQISFVLKKSGSPARVLIKDVFLQVVILGWLATILVVLYVVGHS